MISYAKYKWLIYFFVLCLGIPLQIGHLAGTPIPLSDVAVLASIPFFFQTPWIREKKLLVLALLTSLFGVFLTPLIRGFSINYTNETTELILRSCVSLVYFFRPYLLFFAGYQLVTTREKMNQLFTLFARVFIVIGFAIWVDLVRTGQPVRIEAIQVIGITERYGAMLAGSLFGMPLYGTFGVNSLAVYYSSMCIVIAIVVFFYPKGSHSKFAQMLYGVGISILLYFVYFSQSREAILGVLFFVSCSAFWVFSKWKNPLKIPLLLFVLPILIIIIMSGWGIGNWQEVLLPKYINSFYALREGNWDELFSNRFLLYDFALSDIFKNPFFGTAFGGFQRYGSETAYFTSVVSKNYSPHNQYITAIWKMGFLPGIFYLLFLLSLITNVWHMRRKAVQNNNDGVFYNGIWFYVLTYYVVFMNFWDILLVPLTGSFLMFLLGAIARTYHKVQSASRISVSGSFEY